ncbi:DUF928 domain-containing protein [Mastigocoleus testarum]|uniref:DUF928 domain-containing protein n=1 Tax=Mastigocoleus testarum BC008 TaxID=371196 RepID=A0A0V7ZMH1_9CYAN|nr:DUF928 domain-containing protein [Mastigocoleus testarum]KST65757.1 hypothetical protein BC008_22530 [Mastigocoleus testarum BC008]
MSWMKKNLYTLAIPISLTFSTLSALSVQAHSQKGFVDTPVDTQKVRTWQISQTFKTPNRGTPPATAGGATRGGCTEKKGYLTSLMPKQKLGLTVNEYPTFFWHMSKPEVKTAEFLLLDDNDDLVYETNLKLPKKPGIFSFTLPSEAPALKVNKLYHWYLSVNCSSEETDEDITIEGWVERTKPSLALRIKLNNLAPKYRSKVYADAGIWHEAITNVAQQRCSFPSDSNVMLNWKKLLTSVGLNKVVSEPLNNICEIQS